MENGVKINEECFNSSKFHFTGVWLEFHKNEVLVQRSKN